ncbi:cobalt-precorrin-7 (C(5))-methyltransferase [Dehalogenimonas formicexedens]|uniref:Cobalt-precorrin-7 (C(5))-methyltransferase n=2 Tax=Dehalogenimonas TaxID=670486 RepID=A0A1P8FA27_9CHLR|nr:MULTISPECIES: cobalt-precorrin-7 (C(5))-methyltransferase [Dehalogenimonas]APV45304.1 cobalt-precorrin-7 (C(5))-methyltransferase [Dehalogenimonas formicexedens]KTB49109.1 Precorrin-6B methylase 1 [Dehalogenimonas alkenigignens]
MKWNGLSKAAGCWDLSQPNKVGVSIIGTGPGNGEFITPISERSLDESQIVIGWPRSLRELGLNLKQKVVLQQDASTYQNVQYQSWELGLISNQDVAVLIQDDPTTYPASHDFEKLFPCYKIELVPAISSLQLLAAAACISLEDSLLVVYAPDPQGNIDQNDLMRKRQRMIRSFRNGYNLIVLSDIEQTLSQTASFLLKNRISKNTETVVGECMGCADEQVRTLTLSEVAAGNFHWISCMVVRKEKN